MGFIPSFFTINTCCLPYLYRSMRSFNTSGPNLPAEHYTLKRSALIAKGLDLIQKKRYFTIWAPRQTGKSTYFRLLTAFAAQNGFTPMHINVENFKNESLSTLMDYFRTAAAEQWDIQLKAETFGDLFNEIQACQGKKLVLIVDEIEGLNPDFFGQFLHTIRNLYHSRESHCLKSVILVGVSNIVGVVGDNASPFNIADNLPVPYFTSEEVTELLAQHTRESGQIFEKKVVKKIFEITAGQPGLVNGFANQLVTRWPNRPKIGYKQYLEVEGWYLNVAIDKNFANILNKANEFRPFLETLLFSETDIPFKIDRPAIKTLHINGVIRPNKLGLVEFWVPFYKKRLYDAYYPYTNGERGEISATIQVQRYFTPEGQLNLDALLADYKTYAKRRGFAIFREKDAAGKFISLKEAGLFYSFETWLAAFISQVGGHSYPEAQVGLGRSDLIVNIRGEEMLFECKRYYGERQFVQGHGQLAYYARSLGQKKAVYVVFTPEHLPYPDTVKESRATVRNVEIITYLIPYDEVKDFEG
jgi:type II secretory pathway predicted ATPase ExeA